MSRPIEGSTLEDYKKLAWIVPAIVLPGLAFVAIMFFFTTRVETEVVPPPDSGMRLTATLGPTCPVEREPADADCADKPYAGSFVVEDARGNDVSYLTVGANGQMDVPLEPGMYILRLDGTAALPSMEPQPFRVRAHEYTDVSVTVDSGIR